jgi:glycosyltransferase involved in cell wall biosynthesis
MKLVFVTQELDPSHGALEQSLDLVRGLAARVDELAVVTGRVRWDGLPANARTFTFDAAGRGGRVVAFERSLARATSRSDAVLVHMVPQFALLAAPWARARRVPLLLWYTHWHASRALRAATRVVDVALSVDTSSYPVPTTKLRPIGHAIDVERFAPRPVSPSETLRLLALGRTARWKGLGTLLDALALVEADVALDICGPSLTDDERAHRRELQERAAHDARVTLHDAVPRAQVPELIAAHDVVVSPNEPASGATMDKAVFEAAACERLVVSSNPAFAELLGGLSLPLVVPPRDPAALAAAIERLATADRAEAAAVLRRRVVESHSLEHWADMVLAAITDVRSHRGTAGGRRSAQ